MFVMGKVGSSKVMRKYLVTVPKAVREFLGLSPGDYIDWLIENNKVVVVKGEKSK